MKNNKTIKINEGHPSLGKEVILELESDKKSVYLIRGGYIAKHSKCFSKAMRHKVWDLRSKGMSAVDISDAMHVTFAYTNRLFRGWEATERMDRIRERNAIYTPPIEPYKDKTFLHRLSENVYKQPDFCLETNNSSVMDAYNKMLNSRNTDIPM